MERTKKKQQRIVRSQSMLQANIQIRADEKIKKKKKK